MVRKRDFPLWEVHIKKKKKKLASFLERKLCSLLNGLYNLKNSWVGEWVEDKYLKGLLHSKEKSITSVFEDTRISTVKFFCLSLFTFKFHQLCICCKNAWKGCHFLDVKITFYLYISIDIYLLDEFHWRAYIDRAPYFH